VADSKNIKTLIRTTLEGNVYIRDPQIHEKISIIPSSGNGTPCYQMLSIGSGDEDYASFVTQPISTITDGWLSAFCFLATSQVPTPKIVQFQMCAFLTANPI